MEQAFSVGQRVYQRHNSRTRAFDGVVVTILPRARDNDEPMYVVRFSDHANGQLFRVRQSRLTRLDT